MRILFISGYYKPAYVYGGPILSMSVLCEGLARAGTQVTVLTTDANRRGRLLLPLGRASDVDGVEVWYFPSALRGSYIFSPALEAAVRRRVREFDVVFSNDMWGHVFVPTVSACTRARVPLIVQPHGQLQPWALKHRALKKKLYLAIAGKRLINRVSAVHCTADTERDSFARLGLRPPAFVVPNAIDMARFGKLPPRGGLRSRLGIPESAVQLLFLGRLTGIKRPDIAIETMGALRASGHEAHLVMAGPDEGNLTAKLRAQAHGLGCAAQVHFTGLLAGDEVLQALADTDLLIMPSEVQENFGMSALEAMAAGVPVLAAEGVPAGSWASAAGAGIVVPCSNQGFRTAALEALSHPERLRAMGRAGKDLARRRFDRDVVALEMLAQCEAVIATGRPLPGYLGQRSK